MRWGPPTRRSHRTAAPHTHSGPHPTPAAVRGRSVLVSWRAVLCCAVRRRDCRACVQDMILKKIKAGDTAALSVREVRGVITLEDILEEMIQAEIVDEHDTFVANDSMQRVHKVRPVRPCAACSCGGAAYRPAAAARLSAAQATRISLPCCTVRVCGSAHTQSHRALRCRLYATAVGSSPMPTSAVWRDARILPPCPERAARLPCACARVL